MTFLSKKWRGCFYYFLLMSLFFGEVREAAAVFIPRSVLFPREEEEIYQSTKQAIWNKFPRGSDEIGYLSGQHDEGVAFFVHKTLNQPSGETLKPSGVLYYFENGDFFQVSKEDTPSPHLDEATVETGVAVWSYARGQSRDFCLFDIKKRTSEVIARDFHSLSIQEDGRPVAGVKLTSEIMSFYVNTLKDGWKLLEEFRVDLSLEDPFIYDKSSRNLFYYGFYSSWRIDLETGERDPQSFMFVEPKNEPRDGRWSCDNGMRRFRKRKNGLDTWEGNALFNYLYKHFSSELTKELKGGGFSVVSLWVLPEVGLGFMVDTKDRYHATGQFNFTKETIDWDLERGEELLQPYKESLSEKNYGELDVPWVYGVQDSLWRLSYFVSLPPLGEAPFPTVTYVHGGPNTSDEFGFEAAVQEFTSRGYAVVQVNFRGSLDNIDGINAGIGHAGDSMQRDVSQVLDYLIGKKQIDAENIAIMGGSYGGYAALLGATRGAEFHTGSFKGFKCAIAHFPTSSLLKTVEECMRSIQNMFPLSVHLMAPSVLKSGSLSEEDRQRLYNEAPLTHAALLNIPLLLVHGRHDSVTPLAHSVDFAQRCDQRFLEGLIVVEEDHGWENFGNARVLGYTSEVFLKKYLKGGEVEPLTLEDVLYTDMEFVMGAQNFPELQEMLATYRGFGKLHLTLEVLDWLFPHPHRYSFPYPQYFAHDRNAIMAPRFTIRPSDLYRLFTLLSNAQKELIGMRFVSQ